MTHPTSSSCQSGELGAAIDRVNADTLRLFPALVGKLGGDPSSLLRDVGIDPDSLPRAGIGYRAMADLLERAAAQLQCPDFGMRLARAQGGGKVFGALGVVMRNSKTLGDALDYVASHCRAHSLATGIRIDRARGIQRRLVGHEILLDGLSDRRQLIEQFLLLGHLNALEITGRKVAAREILLRHRPLSSLATYRRHFGCNVHFGQEEDGIVFSEWDLSCPIVDPSPQLYRWATTLVESRSSFRTPPLHTQVRALIVRFLGAEDCSDERVAAELCLHPRTLRRRLRTERTSFHHIKDQVRRDFALAYLQQSDVPLPRVAERLGYSAHSAFSRSCVGWFSASPSQIRERATRRAGVTRVV